MANPSQGGDAKPRDPSGQPGYRTRGMPCPGSMDGRPPAYSVAGRRGRSRPAPMWVGVGCPGWLLGCGCGFAALWRWSRRRVGCSPCWFWCPSCSRCRRLSSEPTARCGWLPWPARRCSGCPGARGISGGAHRWPWTWSTQRPCWPSPWPLLSRASSSLWSSLPSRSVPCMPRPSAAVVSIGALANQVTLALRNSAVHQELTVQATLDDLTGLANRASFNAALSGALGDGPTQNTTSVLFVDLDDFKDVNDVFGHGAGDQLLREVAARLRRATRPGDLCGRIGGDEFAILLRDTGSAAAAEIAQRIVQAVATPAHLDAGVVHVGASVGVEMRGGRDRLD